MSQIKKIAVIGTGVIGAGWIIRFLAHNKIVYAYDKDKKLEKKLDTVVLSSNQVLIWDTLQSIGKKNSIDGFGKLFKN